MSTRELVAVGDAHFEVDLLGHGESVVVIQTALTADELMPVSREIADLGFRVVHYHRRGYAGSSAAPGRHSLASEATDCRDLILALDSGPAHVVGVSFSAAIALTLASTYPEHVRTLTIIEPPPVRSPRTEEFFDLTARLIETYRTRGSQVALEEFMVMLIGTDWRQESERSLPGSVAEMERDAPTFFECDLPALQSWVFGPPQAVPVRCPVLYVAGGATGPWFVDAQTRLPEWLPQTELRFVSGAGHLLTTTHVASAAGLVADFVARCSAPD